MGANFEEEIRSQGCAPGNVHAFIRFLQACCFCHPDVCRASERHAIRNPWTLAVSLAEPFWVFATAPRNGVLIAHSPRGLRGTSRSES